MIKSLFYDISNGFRITWKASKQYAIYNLALSLVLSLLPLLSLWYIKEIIDIVTQYQQAGRTDFIYALITLVIIQLLQAGIQQVLTDIQTVQQQLVIDYLSSQVLTKAVSVDYPYYEKSEYFNSLHLAQQQVMYHAGVLTTSYNQIIQSGFSMLALCIIFIQFNIVYGLLVLVASVPVLLIKYKHAKAIQQLEKDNIVNERKAHYLSRILTDATHAKEVRTFSYGNFFIDKFRDLREKIFWAKKRLSANQAWSETIIQAIEIIILAAIILHLGLSTLDGLITAGSFIFYLQALQRIQSVFKTFLNSFILLFKQRFFLINIKNFLELPSFQKKNEQNFSSIFPDKLQQGIRLQNISFTYPEATEETLTNLNMQFQPGKVIAIIGENGSGKSTLVKLLANLYTPASGNISVEDICITNINSQSYYKNVAVIFQDFNQYHFSVEENILLGHSSDIEKMNTAETEADLKTLVSKMPEGYKTALGKMFGNDMQLSGGQWQKIALARMLYRNAAVMILDEPTSNIDPLAEYEILQKITEKKKDKIIILITHRLHNLKFADHIYLMDNGQVHGEGTVNELLANNPLFKQMYERQELEKGFFKLNA